MQLLQQDLDSWELEQLLSGKYDDCGCRLTIMAGAGGTEAQDWAQMLQRMYRRFFERRGFKYRIIEEEVGMEIILIDLACCIYVVVGPRRGEADIVLLLVVGGCLAFVARAV